MTIEADIITIYEKMGSAPPKSFNCPYPTYLCGKAFSHQYQFNVMKDQMDFFCEYNTDLIVWLEKEGFQLNYHSENYRDELNQYYLDINQFGVDPTKLEEPIKWNCNVKRVYVSDKQKVKVIVVDNIKLQLFIHYWLFAGIAGRTESNMEKKFVHDLWNAGEGFFRIVNSIPTISIDLINQLSPNLYPHGIFLPHI